MASRNELIGEVDDGSAERPTQKSSSMQK